MKRKKTSKEVFTKDRGSSKDLPAAQAVPSSSSYEDSEEETLEEDRPVRPGAPAAPDLRKPAEPKGVPSTAAKTTAAEAESYRCEHCNARFSNRSGFEQHQQWSKKVFGHAMLCSPEAQELGQGPRRGKETVAAAAGQVVPGPWRRGALQQGPGLQA